MPLLLYKVCHPVRPSCFVASGGFPCHCGCQSGYRATLALVGDCQVDPAAARGSGESAVVVSAAQAAVDTFLRRTVPDDTRALSEFLAAHPQSVLAAPILALRAQNQLQHSRYGSALADWQQAWSWLRNVTDGPQKALADEVYGQLVYTSARLGRLSETRQWLAEGADRPIQGMAATKVYYARSAYELVSGSPAASLRCGPNALLRLLAYFEPARMWDEAVRELPASERGVSLAQLETAANALGVGQFRSVRVSAQEELPVPAVVHWKVDHFGALVARWQGGYVVDDPTFGGPRWVSRTALAEEGSGWVLAWERYTPNLAQLGTLGTAEETGQVWGAGPAPDKSTEGTTSDDEKVKSDSCPRGMAVWNVHSQLVNLTITDEPVGYVPPVGPAMVFRATYNAKEASGFFIMHSNLGNYWKHNWMGAVQPISGTDATLYREGGGSDRFTGYDANSQRYQPEHRTASILSFVPSAGGQNEYYVHTSSDGSERHYATKVIVSAGTFYYLTRVLDARGNAATLQYDPVQLASGNLKLLSVTDPLGQQLTFTYAHPSDPFKITAVQDHFGRSASFGYGTASGLVRLTSITDPAGIYSNFTYGDTLNPERVTALVTPYGTTQFNDLGLSAPSAGLTITGPLAGDVERVEFRHAAEVDASADRPVAPGFSTVTTVSNPGGGSSFVPENRFSIGGTQQRFRNNAHYFRNSYYWDRKAIASGSGTAYYNYARMQQFSHSPYNASATSRSLELTRPPYLFGSSTYYYYGDHPTNSAGMQEPMFRGVTGGRPIVVGRRLDDKGELAGADQVGNAITESATNALGNPTVTRTPQGTAIGTGSGISARETTTTYYQHSGYTNATGSGPLYLTHPQNLVDVSEVRMTRNGANTLLFKAIYAGPRRPTQITGPDGKVTTRTYNSYGQVLTETAPLRTVGGVVQPAETVTYVYDRTEPGTGFTYGYLLRIERPLGHTTVLTYDSAKRVASITEPDGYARTFEYDNLDRLTYERFPADNTYRQTIYDRLDAQQSRDRRGRWTTRVFDARRQLVSETDPEMRTTLYEWCKCGALQKLTDPRNNATTWERDLLGRVKYKIYADHTTGNVRRDEYQYYDQGLVEANEDPVPYFNGKVRRMIPSSGASVRYFYNHDGSLFSTSLEGSINKTQARYTYDADYPRVVSIDEGSMTNGTVATALTYAYHPYAAQGGGQLYQESRIVTGSTYTVTHLYDELGRRMERSVDGAGTATWKFDALGRVVENVNPLGTFLRTYDGATARPMSIEAAPVLYTAFQYSHQLRNTTNPNRDLVTLTHSNWASAGTAGTTRFARFRYLEHDAEGVFAKEQIDFGTVANSTYSKQLAFVLDNVDQLKNVNVTVGTGLPSGAYSTAESYDYDPAGNRTAANGVSTSYNSVNQSTTSGTTYDPFGNLTQLPASHGFVWQAASGTPVSNLLGTINLAGSAGTVAFAYDAKKRWRTITTTLSGQSAVQVNYVWSGDNLVEERDAQNRVTRRYYAEGEERIAYDGSGNPTSLKLWYLQDHLGTVREVRDSSQTLRAQYDYDAWGKRVKTAGDLEVARGFTGHLLNEASGLYLTRWRAYSPTLGRWINRDPIGEKGGGNLYAYVQNKAQNRIDPLGLRIFPCDFVGPLLDTKGFDSAQMEAIESILALEASMETWALESARSTAWDASNTLPGQHLLAPFNADMRNLNMNIIHPIHGELDLDWFNDVTFVANGLPGFASSAYAFMKTAWALSRHNQTGTNRVPFTDPGERTAVMLVQEGARYRDIFPPSVLERFRR